jgi:hypothetical protein
MAIPRLAHDVCRLRFLHRDSRGLRRTLVAAVLLGGVASIAAAAPTTFTNRSAFESSLPAGSFFNNFSSVPNTGLNPVTSVTGTGGTPTVGYTITAPTLGLGVFPDVGFKAVGNWGSSNSMIVTFNTGNVFSAGGDIWISDIDGNRLAGTVTVNFSDGSTVAVPSTTSGTFGFAGITTDSAPLTSMTVVGLGGSSYLNLSNFSVAVPEPSSIVLAVMGTAGLAAGAVRRRRQRG